MELESSLPRTIQVKSEGLPRNTYIIESKDALEILLKPWLVGAHLANPARESSIEFLRIAYHLCPELQESCSENVAEVVPLAGSLYYSLGEAFDAVFGETINRCFIGAKRRLTKTGWITDLAYLNFEAMPKSPLIIIGDTVATGGTLEAIIRESLKVAPDARALLLYSIAGGVVGAAKVRELEQELDIPVYFFFSNAIFGVEENGTDMPWLHPGTITTESNRRTAEDHYGADLGARWCCIWDWGERAKQPLEHLRNLLARCARELQEAQSSQTSAILEKVKLKTQETIALWTKKIELV
jgi:hypothetical protein